MKKFRELFENDNACTGPFFDWLIRYCCPLIMTTSIEVGYKLGILYGAFVGAK
jgi:hypothetical protein